MIHPKKLSASEAKKEAALIQTKAWMKTASLSVCISLASLGVAGWNMHERLGTEKRLAALNSQLRPSAGQFAEQAATFLKQANLKDAGTQIGYALTLEPNHAPYLVIAGNVSESRFEFEAAMTSYQAALLADPTNAAAAEGYALCSRLSRAGENRQNLSTNALYALHRAMMKQGRIAEAVRIAERLPKDTHLLCDTWQQRLEAEGLKARVDCNAEGELLVILQGAAQARLSALQGMPLVSLTLANTDVRDLRPLEGLALRELDLSRTGVMDLGPLKGMPLRTLKMDRTLVADLEPLRGMQLRELTLSETAVRTVSALHSMPLRTLDISGTEVVDIRPLATVPLFKLNLSNTPVGEISPLKHLPITSLSLADTQVDDISALSQAPLGELSLARTKVASLQPLAHSPLEALELIGCTEIRDLTPLGQCKRLQRLILPTSEVDSSVLASNPRLSVMR